MDGCQRTCARRACTPRVRAARKGVHARRGAPSMTRRSTLVIMTVMMMKHTTPVVHGNRIGGETSTRTRRHRRRRSARCDSRLQLKYYNEQSAYVLSPLLPYSPIHQLQLPAPPSAAESHPPEASYPFPPRAQLRSRAVPPRQPVLLPATPSSKSNKTGEIYEKNGRKLFSIN